MTKIQKKDPWANKNKKHHNHHGRQRHTAIVFDENERDQYLKGMFGAKKRRKEHHEKKVQEQEKQNKK